jgi:hypothetical protein
LLKALNNIVLNCSIKKNVPSKSHHTLSGWKYFGNFCPNPSNPHKFWPKHFDFDNGKPRSYSPHLSFCMVCNSSHLVQTIPWVYNMPISVLSCCNLGLEPKVRVVINVFLWHFILTLKLSFLTPLISLPLHFSIPNW